MTTMTPAFATVDCPPTSPVGAPAQPPSGRDDGRWRAVAARDTHADGAFYYSVASTGVYCRPSCAARLPRRENVAFHETCAAAERAGFPACKRCRPDAARIGYAFGDSSVGKFAVAATERGVCAILLGGSKNALQSELKSRFGGAVLVRDGAAAASRVAAVAACINAPGCGVDLPLEVRGTDFQQRVWRALREIPAGATASYADIAERIGAPKAARAVARACAANPLAVIIPCHRVVRRDGGLSGYRWGVARKRALLAREATA